MRCRAFHRTRGVITGCKLSNPGDQRACECRLKCVLDAALHALCFAVLPTPSSPRAREGGGVYPRLPGLAANVASTAGVVATRAHQEHTPFVCHILEKGMLVVDLGAAVFAMEFAEGGEQIVLPLGIRTRRWQRAAAPSCRRRAGRRRRRAGRHPATTRRTGQNEFLGADVNSTHTGRARCGIDASARGIDPPR